MVDDSAEAHLRGRGLERILAGRASPPRRRRGSSPSRARCCGMRWQPALVRRAVRERTWRRTPRCGMLSSLVSRGCGEGLSLARDPAGVQRNRPFTTHPSACLCYSGPHASRVWAPMSKSGPLDRRDDGATLALIIQRRTAMTLVAIQTARPTRIALWTLQALLAALFLFAGGMKLVMPLAALTQQTPLPERSSGSSGCSRFWAGSASCSRNPQASSIPDAACCRGPRDHHERRHRREHDEPASRVRARAGHRRRAAVRGRTGRLPLGRTR